MMTTAPSRAWPSRALALDLETTGLDPRSGRILGLSIHGGSRVSMALAYDDLSTYAPIEWTPGSPNWWEALKERGAIVPQELAYITENYQLVCHHAKFDVKWLIHKGYEVVSFHCTQLMAYLLEPSRPVGLKDLAPLVGEYKMAPPSDFTHWDEDMAAYCLQDSKATWGLFQRFRRELDDDPKLKRVYREMELPMLRALIAMELRGVRVNRGRAEALRSELSERLARLEEGLTGILVPGKEYHYKHQCPFHGAAPMVRNEAGEWYAPPEWTQTTGYTTRKGVTTYDHHRLENLSLTNPNHLVWLLKERYGWEPKAFTKTGKALLTEDVLEGLRDEYPLVGTILEHRQLHKVVSTYLTPILNALDAEDVLRGDFNQTVTLTGRLSSSNPNLQNIPKSGELGHQMRDLFVSRPGYHLVGIDLQAIEARVLAHYLVTLLNSTQMRDAILSGDMHQANADAWGMTRDEAKTALYAIIYGAGPTKLGNGDPKRGHRMLERVYSVYPIDRLKAMMLARMVRKGGIGYTAFGRRLYYPDVDPDVALERTKRDTTNPSSKHYGESPKALAKERHARACRQAFNAKLQGTGADVIKILTVRYGEAEVKYHWGSHILLQVHDELVVEVPYKEVTEVSDCLLRLFSTPLLPGCPIRGELKVGNTWGDIH